MITFIEHINNLDQTVNVLDNLIKGGDVKSLFSIPVESISSLPEKSKKEFASFLRRILLNSDEVLWKRLWKYTFPVWDQSIGNMKLGNDVLNQISYKVMEETNSEFFISYSGNMSKGTLYSYTNKNVKVVVSKYSYKWNSYSELFSSVLNDYTKYFNNYRQKLGY